MNPFLDIRTLSVVLGVTIFSLGLSMVCYTASRKTYAGFGAWTVANILVSSAFFLVGFRNILSSFITIIVANALIYSALALFYLGFKAMAGKKGKPYFHMAAVFLLSFVLVPFFTYVSPSVNARVVIISFAAAVYFLASNAVLVREVQQRLTQLNKLLPATLIALSTLFLVRGVFFLLPLNTINDFLSGGVFHGVALLSTIILAVFFVVGLMQLNSQLLESELYREREELRESEERYRLLVDQSLQGLVIAQDNPMRLSFVSKPMESITGYAQEELENFSEQKLMALIHPEDRERFFGNFQNRLRGNEVPPFYESRIVHKTKGNRWVGIYSSRIDYKGAPATHTVFLDITERKRAEAALKESEDKFRSFAEQSLVGIYLISGEVFKYVNPKFAEIFGYSVDECLADMRFPQLVHPDDLARVRRQVQRRLSGETEAFRYSFRGVKKSGETMHVEIFGSSMVFKGTRVATGTMLDISDRIEAENALKESEARLKKAQSVARLGNWEYEISTGKIWGSEQAFRIYGIERTSPYLPLERVEACIPDALRVNQALVDLIQDNKPYDLEYEVRHEGSGQNLIIHSIAELVYENSSPVKVLGVISDITEQKKAERERKDLEHQLRRAQKMEALGLLAGGVAHDLNNILSGIVTYPELLLMDLPEDSPLRKPIKTIQESGMRAADVVSDLLTIARGVATGKEALNLNSIVTEYLVSPEYRKLEKMHSLVNLNTQLESGLLNLLGSPIHIKKALMNLVTNAAEAIEGSGTVTISTVNRYLDEPLKGYEDVRTGEYVMLTVSDDGSGISPLDLERIFEPFYTKKAMGKSGTGLGLAVVWNTVQDHDGYINVKSGEKGSSFELYFPVSREEVVAAKAQTPVENYLGRGEKILVVDDEENQREIAIGILKRLGYAAEAVSSGEEAIIYVKEHPLDLIVLDMIMPKGINGRETYEKIKKIRPGQKVIISSGYTRTEEVKAAQGLGAGQYIKKPYTLQKIGMAVKEELEK